MSLVSSLAIMGFICALVVQLAIHKVPEGHVGVYWRGGALINQITEPGYAFKIPLFTTWAPIQVTMQTDSVTNIPCGTSGGVMVYFEKIEVVNRLRKKDVYNTIKTYGEDYDKIWIFDKIHHEINQFCSGHTLQEVYIGLFDTLDESLVKALQSDCDKYNTGIEIVAVRVTKPRIPDSIRKNYEAVENEKTRLMLATQTQRVIEKEAETERIRATINAQKLAAVAKIELDQQIMEKEGLKTIQEIEDTMHLSRIKARADAEYYRAIKEIQANREKLSPEFLRLRLIESISSNTKIFFGDKLPTLFSSVEALLRDPSFVSTPESADAAAGSANGGDSAQHTELATVNKEPPAVIGSGRASSQTHAVTVPPIEAPNQR